MQTTYRDILGATAGYCRGTLSGIISGITEIFCGYFQGLYGPGCTIDNHNNFNNLIEFNGTPSKALVRDYPVYSQVFVDNCY